MFARLFVLFTVIPLLELALLIKVGEHIGAGNTIMIVIVTGILGAYFARQQGFYVISRIQQDMAQGRMPTDSLLDGLMVFAGALLLITPGLVTDLLGFAFLVPASRTVIREWIRRYIQRRMQHGSGSTRVNISQDDWSSDDKH
ncbi:membrane protein FxsA [candidate division KSB1 bacterium]|nr:membrane protein FxsA [candidate division KSB1 bacterium]